MVLCGWQHISQTQGVLLLLLLSALAEESELLLDQYATLCEHLRLVQELLLSALVEESEDLQSCSCLGTADAATLCEDLRLVLLESLLSCPAAAETAIDPIRKETA